jgi:hypothetical protein
MIKNRKIILIKFIFENVNIYIHINIISFLQLECIINDILLFLVLVIKYF